MVQESIKQTQSRYRLADLTRREGDLKKRLERLSAEEQALRSPMRLARLVREKDLDLFSLGTAKPGAGAWAEKRRPGEILDPEFAAAASGDDIRVATVGQW